jgi:hypothetical protein
MKHLTLHCLRSSEIFNLLKPPIGVEELGKAGDLRYCAIGAFLGSNFICYRIPIFFGVSVAGPEAFVSIVDSGEGGSYDDSLDGRVVFVDGL